MNATATFWISLWCCLIATMPLFGQQQKTSVKVFDVQQGLKTNGFRKVLQDGSGFVWTIYGSGVQRFDGKNTDTYFTNDQIYSMVLDGHDAIWVSTPKGIYKYDQDEQRFLIVLPQQADVGPKLLFCLQGPTVFYMDAEGIYRYKGSSSSFVKEKDLGAGLEKNIALRFPKFDNIGHTLYYADDTHVWRHDLHSGKKDTLAIIEVGWVHAISKDEIIVTNWEGKTWNYNFATHERLRLTLPGPDRFLYVHDAAWVRGTTWYMATSKGLLSFDLRTKKIRPVALSLGGVPFPAKVFRAVYRHKDGTLWTATETKLLRIYDAHTNIQFIRSNPHDPEARFDSRVRNFAEDDEGNLWLATGHGLTQWNIKKNTFFTLSATEGNPNGLNHASIRGLVYDGTYLIIGQTNKGIWLYEPKRKTFKRPNFTEDDIGSLLKEKLSQDFIKQIKTLSNGDHIISARDGAYVMDGSTYTVREIDFPGSTQNVVFSYEDSKGAIFIGTHQGLFCLNADYTLRYALTEAIGNSAAICVLEYNNGHYLGTRQGLYYMTTTSDTISVKKILPELQDETIKTLFNDEQQHLWLVSESKLYRLALKTGKLADFGYAENIQGDFFYTNSFYRNTEGRVFLGGISGINYFYPEKLVVHPKTLHPYLRNLTLLGASDTITFSNKLELGYHERNMMLTFATPYFGNPSDVHYRYRLQEDEDWFNLGANNNVTLWKLPSGDYSFQMAASMEEGVWHPSSNTIQFTIEAPFWERWWFKTTWISLAICLPIMLLTFQRRKLMMEKQLKGFATSLYGQNNVDGILWATARYCVQELGFVDCVVYLLDDRRQNLLQKAAFGIKSPHGKKIVNKIEIPINKGIVGAVARTGTAERIKNTAKDPRYILDIEMGLSEITVPINVDGKVFAILDSEHPKRNFYGKRHLELLKKIASICSERLTKFLSEEKLRSTISRDLHDEMGSTLTSIHIISKIAEQDAVENSTVKKQFGQIKKHASGMMEQMGDMVWVVNPANDGLDKLIFRIKEYAVEVLEPLDIALHFKSMVIANTIKLNTAQRKNIYLIAKEALNNIVKHSHAKAVSITFKKQKELLAMVIVDDGVGFELSSNHQGNGLTNFQKRVDEINAALQIRTSKNKGVSVSILIKKIDLNTQEPQMK